MFEMLLEIINNKGHLNRKISNSIKCNVELRLNVFCWIHIFILINIALIRRQFLGLANFRHSKGYILLLL